MDNNSIQFAKTISELYEQIKCQICFKPVEEFTELKCGHSFCKICYHNVIAPKTISICYVCKTVISKKTHLYKNDFGNKLSEAIKQTMEQLNSVPECNKVFSKLTKQVHSRNSDILFDELIANPIVKPLTITKTTNPRTYYGKNVEKSFVNNEEDSFVDETVRTNVKKWLEDVEIASKNDENEQNTENINTSKGLKKRAFSNEFEKHSESKRKRIPPDDQKKNEKPNISDNKLTMKTRRTSGHNETMNSSIDSGWQRIEKIQKSINKKKCKELKVILHKEISSENIKQLNNEALDIVNSTNQCKELDSDSDVYTAATQVYEENDSYNNKVLDIEFNDSLNSGKVLDYVVAKLETCVTYLEYKKISQKLTTDLKALLTLLTKLRDSKETDKVDKNIQVCFECDCKKNLDYKDENIQTSFSYETKEEKNIPKIETTGNIPISNILNQSSTKLQNQNKLESVNVEQEHIFSSSLDNFDFDTQDIINKQNNCVNQCDNKTKDSQKSQVKSIRNSGKSNTSSVLAITKDDLVENLINKSINSRIQLIKKNFKRIRPNFSDSDTDEENEKKKICVPKLNRSNLSIQFDSNTEQFQDKEQDQYSEVEYDNKRSNSEDMMRACDELIANATKKIVTAEVHHTANSRTPSQKAVFPDDDLFNTKNLAEINKNIDEIDKVLQTENISKHSNIIPDKNNHNDPTTMLKSQDSMTLFTSYSENRVKSIKQLNNIKKKKEDNFVETLNDGQMDDALSKIEFPEVENTNGKITILQNMKLKSQDKTNDRVNDLEDDIIETTPQKDKSSRVQENKSSLSQLFDNDITDSQLLLALPLALPPPPGFEDDNIQENNKSIDNDNDITVIDLLSQQVKKNHLTGKMLTKCTSMNQIKTLLNNLDEKSQLNEVGLNSTRIETSTPLSQNNNRSRISLSLSPIAREDDNLTSTKVGKQSPLVVKPSKTENTKPDLIYVSSTSNQSSIRNYVKPVKKKPCIACSRLSRDKMILIMQINNKKLAKFSENFNKNVTHLIVATDRPNQVKDHTIKYVLAVASGIWVLSFDWIEECLRKNCIVPEESYEVLDAYGAPGPKLSRLRREIRPLLAGFKFFCAPPFVSTKIEQVEEVIKLAGGETVASQKELMKYSKSFTCIIITEAKATQDFAIYEGWLADYKVITVDIEWLSRSIGQYKVCSVRKFLLCGDSSISELGYPTELLVSEPLTFSENFQ